LTPRSTSTHNHRVRVPGCRALVALALAPWLAVSSAAPPEHLHHGAVDHRNSVVHRHVESHAIDTHPREGAEFDHDEECVIWLNDVGLVPSTQSLAVSWTVAGAARETTPDSTTWVALARYETSPSHGPPRPCRSPRAPPLASRLT
jgi:hypothetical protein